MSFTHKFFQSKYLSDSLITSAHNVEVSTICYKKMRRTGTTDRQPVVSVTACQWEHLKCRRPCAQSQRTNRFVRSHVKLAFTDWLCTE